MVHVGASNTRKPLLLPSQDVEQDFHKKVLEHVRLRREHQRCDQEVGAVNTVHALETEKRHLAPLRPGTASNTWRKLTRPVSARRPRTAPEDVGAKYLSTSLVPCASPPPSRNKRKAVRLRPVAVRPGVDELTAVLKQPGPSPFKIVELHTSCTVTTSDGNAELPPKTWLVLEGVGLDGTYLASAAGGGYIPDDVKVVMFPVQMERLHAAAAEANFQRASRRSSVLALKHAAYLLELLCDRQRDVPPSVLPTPTASCSSIATEETCARLLRMEKVVEARSVAARLRVKPQQSASIFAPVDSEDSVGVHRGNVKQLKGVRVMQEFLEFARRRFGNAIRAWWQLDTEENLKLGEMLFKRRCLDIGFSGNLNALWYYVDGDKSGLVSIFEIHPPSAMILASFKRLIEEQFNGHPEQAFARLDENKSGRISKAEFIREVRRLGYKGPASTLFDLLDRSGLGWVVIDDTKYLSSWTPRPYLVVNPDVKGLESLKAALIAYHGQPLFRAWRRWLDRDGKMRVSWEEFMDTCKAALAANTDISDLPSSQQEVAEVWRAIDQDCLGYITLRDFDPPSYEAISQFKRWADEHHGNVLKSFNHLDKLAAGNSGRLAFCDFKKICGGKDGYPGNAKFLFECLDVHSKHTLGPEDVRWLDSWDLVLDEYQDKVRQRLTVQTASVLDI